MAGLLGDSIDDPKSMATWQLVGGLLSPGSFGQGLSRGMSGYQGTMANAQDMRLKEQQILSAKQEQQLRDVQIRRAMQQLSIGDYFAGGNSPGSPGTPGTPGTQLQAEQPMQSPASTALASGAAQGSVGPTMANAARMDAMPAQQPTTITPPQKSRLEGLSQDQIAAGVMSGAIPKELVELWTSSKFGRALPPGWKQNLDGTMTYVPDPTKGVTVGPDGKTVMQMPGAASTMGAMAEATKAGEMRGANSQTVADPSKFIGADGRPFVGSMSDLLRNVSPPTPPQAPAGFGALPPAQRAAVLADNAKQGSPAFTINGQAQPAQAQPQGAFGGFQTPAQAEAEKLRATQGVHLDTDPIVKFKTELLTGAHKSNADVLAKLQDTVRSEAELQNRNIQLAPMLDKLQTGGFAPEQRIALANSLQTSGFVPDMLKGKVAAWVANGDPSTGKVIENQLAAAGIKTMLDTLDKEGKPNRAIFEAIHNAQESVKSGNATLKQVFALQKQLYDWHYSQEQQMADAMASNDYNPMTLQSQLSKKRNDSLTAPTQTAAPQAAPQTATMQYNPKTGKIEALK